MMSSGWRMRLGGLMRKEWLQVGRDPSSLAIALVLPLVLLFIFGYGVSLDAKNIALAVVVEHPGNQSTAFAASFLRNPSFQPRLMRGIQEAEEALRRAEVQGIVWLRGDFDADSLGRTGPPIGVLVNGVDANTARLVEGYIQGIWQGWLARQAESGGSALTPPLRLEERIWYNPAARSTDYLVPGVVAVVMTLIGSLLTALVVAREWERGTMESLLVTRISVLEFLAGKLIPYFLLGMAGLVIALVMARFFFAVPIRGSLPLLFAVSALFLLVALGMGLAISTVCRSQFIAAEVALVVTFLPAFLLSGFVFDIRSMPFLVQGITHLIAARYYVAMLQTLFLVGDVGAIMLVNSLCLLVMAVFFLGLTYKKTGKRLD